MILDRFIEPTTGLGNMGKRWEKREFLTLTICIAGRGSYSKRERGYGSKKRKGRIVKTTNTRDTIHTKQGDLGRGGKIGPRVDERTGEWCAGTDGRNPGPSLYCCLQSSGLAVAPPLPFPPFPAFLRGGADPSESESCDRCKTEKSKVS